MKNPFSQVASHISESIDVYESIAKYDEAAKALFKEKKILACILKECASEFKDCSIDDIAYKYIEGDVRISQVGVNPDTTHSRASKDNPHTDECHPVIAGRNSEQTTYSEGTNFYDIIFDAVAPGSGEPIQLILNIEIQGNEKKPYPITKRALYYAARMISAQYGSVFMNKQYEKIRKVYSIWVIIDAKNQKSANTITQYKVTEHSLFGNFKEDILNYDLINIALIRLPRSNENATSLIRLLSVYLSNIPTQERKNILESEYNISMTDFSKEGKDMCNLGECIYEKGVAQGIEKGIEQGIKATIESLRECNISDETIVSKIMQKYHLDIETALKYMN